MLQPSCWRVYIFFLGLLFPLIIFPRLLISISASVRLFIFAFVAIPVDWPAHLEIEWFFSLVDRSC